MTTAAMSIVVTVSVSSVLILTEPTPTI